MRLHQCTTTRIVFVAVTCSDVEEQCWLFLGEFKYLGVFCNNLISFSPLFFRSHVCRHIALSPAVPVSPKPPVSSVESARSGVSGHVAGQCFLTSLSWHRFVYLLRVEGEMRRRPIEQHIVTSQVSRVLTSSVSCEVRMCVVCISPKMRLDELIYCCVVARLFFIFYYPLPLSPSLHPHRPQHLQRVDLGAAAAKGEEKWLWLLINVIMTLLIIVVIVFDGLCWFARL